MLCIVQRDLNYLKHQATEVRTILISSNDWINMPEVAENLENDITDARRQFNSTPGWGTKIRWIRSDFYNVKSFSAVPSRALDNLSTRGGVRLWVTFLHTWDDRRFHKHEKNTWNMIAETFAGILSAQTPLENWIVSPIL